MGQTPTRLRSWKKYPSDGRVQPNHIRKHVRDLLPPIKSRDRWKGTDAYRPWPPTRD